MNPDEVVVHVVDRKRSQMVFDFLRERIGEARKTAVVHPHGEVLALYVACASTGVFFKLTHYPVINVVTVLILCVWLLNIAGGLPSLGHLSLR